MTYVTLLAVWRDFHICKLVIGEMGDTEIEERADARSKKRKTIKIKVPSIGIGKTDGEGGFFKKIKKDKKTTSDKGIGIKPVPKVELEKPNPDISSDRQPEGVTRIKLPSFHKEEEITAHEEDLEETFKTEKESRDLGFNKKLLKKLAIAQKRVFEVYDYKKHGSLLDINLTSPYILVNEYWVEPGLAKVIIALNTRSKLKEYLLFEPELSPFEYELLERIHEDLRDVLILTDDELGIERKKLLIAKTSDLIDYYGIRLEKESLFKIEYYLIRNYLGWGRINALMIDPFIEDVSCDGDNVPIFLFIEKNRTLKQIFHLIPTL